MQHFRRHLTYANVAATLALVIAVAGSATAIAGGKATKNSVTSSSIKPHNVTASDLAGIRVVQVTGQLLPHSPLASRASDSSVVEDFTAAVSDLAVSRPGNGGWLVQQSEGPDTLMAAYALCLKNRPGN